MTKLNTRNLFREINEHVISLTNYHVRVLRLELTDFEKLDYNIRQVLIKYRVHHQLGCRERLYLLRKELGKSLHNIKMRSEQILFQVKGVLVKYKLTSTRRVVILRMGEKRKYEWIPK